MTKRDEALAALREIEKWSVVGNMTELGMRYALKYINTLVTRALTIASLESGGGEGVGLSVGDLHVIYRTAAYTKHQELFKGAPFPASSPQHIAGIEAIASRLAQSPQVVSRHDLDVWFYGNEGKPDPFGSGRQLFSIEKGLDAIFAQLQLPGPVKIEGKAYTEEQLLQLFKAGRSYGYAEIHGEEDRGLDFAFNEAVSKIPSPDTSKIDAAVEALKGAKSFIQSAVDLEYNHSAMGCGLEDRGIVDRYDAMHHGWEEALEKACWGHGEVVEQIDKALAILKSRPADGEACLWRQDDDGNWNTDCKEMFVLIDATPEENHMKFCTYCGKSIRQQPYTMPDDEETPQ